ncbi:hypothetical protein BS47DRAFT_1391799 [Hydnum rufescens UP504]|uniref:MutL C-terminal dimerisation domain-containing protein n=1 Tax=Hydnum rufescens UP504 TaxID=1448309 RepID=A0A9P6B0I9_9AGAM|nr:hypothetical protein BS47DRAFT_1391799 [Hydnum rufescens UP504]
MQHIQSLPQETRTRLRSTQILTSLPQLVSELVQNSLDSRASHIDIGLDFADWSCWVRDDGVGIPVQGLDHIGSGDDNGRYGSSKAPTTHGLDDLTTFGFRGEALASAADLACLEISSRSRPQSESWSVIAKGGKRLYFGPAIRWRRERPGTVVCIRDAFYNLPIRRISHPSASRTLELIMKDTQSFSLVFPAVAFSVENTTRDRDGELRKTRALSIPKTSSILHKFRAVFGRALAEASDRIRKSPRKSERHSVYVLSLDVPSRTLDACFVPSKDTVQFQDLNSVSSFLISTVQSFLERHGFLASTSLMHASREATDALHRHSALLPTGPADSERPPIPSHYSFGDHDAPPIYTLRTTARLRLKEEADAVYEADLDAAPIFTIENRTGDSYPRSHNSFHAWMKLCRKMQYPTIQFAPTWTRPGFGDRDSNPAASGEWENPVYYERERDVPTISIATTHDSTPAFLAPGPSFQGRASTSRFFDSDALNPEAISITRRFTREDLPTPRSWARWTRSEDTSTVVLIDQHAADERIRVERFLEELCIGFLDENMERRDISAHPTRVLLTMAEARSIATSSDVQAVFDRWGLRFSKDSVQNIVRQLANNDETWYTQLEIETVPEVIADKLISEDELQDVIKGFLARLDSEGTSYGPPKEDPNMVHMKEANRWMKALRWCPKELLDLINSKACRGAIMFNDPLTHEQCSRLVSQLSRTLFPFQCAHGRPSLVPITSVQEKPGLQPARMITWSDYGSRSQGIINR